MTQTYNTRPATLAMIAKGDERARYVVALRNGGYTFEQIAQDLGVTIRTAQNLYYSSRKRLQRLGEL